MCLLRALRSLRKEIAEKSSIPVYAVVTNDQLAHMVKHPPKAPKDLLAISGVGEARVKQYGETAPVPLSSIVFMHKNLHSPAQCLRVNTISA